MRKERINVKMLSIKDLEKSLVNARGTTKLKIINELTKRSK